MKDGMIEIILNEDERIEIVDGDKAALKNGVISVKGIELRPLNVGKFDIPRRYNGLLLFW